MVNFLSEEVIFKRQIKRHNMSKRKDLAIFVIL